MNSEPLSATAQMALNAINGVPQKGIPSWILHTMEIPIIEKLAGVADGEYRKDPDNVYIQAQKRTGACLLDQYLAKNPLDAERWAKGEGHGVNTGMDAIVADGMTIDSPEAAVEHMEAFEMPRYRKMIAEFDEAAVIAKRIETERALQEKLAPEILKVPYGIVVFPHFMYGKYGFTNYFMAYALYPDVIEKMFSVQADYFALINAATAKAYEQGHFPPLLRLDFDMADSRGTMVDIKTLDKIWFPHFVRALAPMLKTNVKMIWHCDGNLMEMVPRLLDCGIRGFQGFQYEDGMDYERICEMKTKDGEDLFIVGGVSVTTTLPLGTPDDVKKQLKWLVDYGPRNTLLLGGSSSIAPGTPEKNIMTLVEGLRYYRENGRG